MSDVKPNLQLAQKEREFEIAQLRLNIQSQELRILQMDDEKSRIEGNIAATNNAIAELEKLSINLK